jgi:DNA repair protein RadC
METELVPVIVDDGARGESELPLWKRIIRHVGQRFDLAMSKASVLVMVLLVKAITSAMVTAAAKAIRSAATKRPSNKNKKKLHAASTP